MAQVAWITGASAGIGRAVAERLAQEGWIVAATARGVEPLEALANKAIDGPGRIVAMPGDVTDAKDMDAVVARIEDTIGPIQLAILNAGIYLPVSAVPFDRPAFVKSFAVNLGGAVNGLAPLIDRMVARRTGRIYLMASVAGYSGLPTSAAYGATKAGLINMAESLKFDLDPHGVSIGVINPGFVRTPATDKNPFPMPFLMEVEAAADRVVKGIEAGRFEITFPRRFTYILKLLRLLPYWLYFPLVKRGTGKG